MYSYLGLFKTNSVDNIQNMGGRNSNFELLRIICMLFIVCGHIIMARQDMFVGTSSWYIGQFVYPFVIVAVDVFVLISGYFGIKLKVSKLLRLNTMVTFYSVALLLLAIYCLDYSFHPRKDWMYLFPVLTKKYWFITIYFGLCLCSP